MKFNYFSAPCWNNNHCQAAIMYRRSVLTSLPLRSTPKRRVKGPIAIHQSQRPPEAADIDFSSLNLKYPLKIQPSTLPFSGWSIPPATAPQGYPFFVSRTLNSKALPVYTDFLSQGKTKVVTIVRKCGGDVLELKNDMEKVVGKPVYIKPGKLVVDGNYSRRLKMWLTGLGF